MTPEQAQSLDAFFASKTSKELSRVQILCGPKARAILREHLLEQLAQGYPVEEREKMRQHGRRCRLEINGIEVRDAGPLIGVDELLVYIEPALSFRIEDPPPFKWSTPDGR